MWTSLNLLLSLVNDVLDLTLIKNSKIPVERKFFNPTEVLKFVHSLMAYQATSQKIKFGFKVISNSLISNTGMSIGDVKELEETELPQNLVGDEVRLK